VSTSKEPVLIDADGIRTTVGLIVERQAEIPVTLRWLDGTITVNEERCAAPAAERGGG
jgi:hypothetical protein